MSYYAPVTKSGISGWNRTTSYPIAFASGSCSTSGGYIYCLGNTKGNPEAAFYAPISSTGIGQWRQTTSYPTPFFGAQCNAYNGYIYCLGDAYFNANAIKAYYENLQKSSNANQILAMLAGGTLLANVSEDYYAQLSPSGIGPWTPVNPVPQPLTGGSCTISQGTIYCIGGNSAVYNVGSLASYNAIQSSNESAYLASLTGSNSTSSSFYAGIRANGSIANWSYTSPYLEQMQSASCTSGAGYIYCIGGLNGLQDVYFSQISPSSGISDWLESTSYPIPFYSGYCSTDVGA